MPQTAPRPFLFTLASKPAALIAAASLALPLCAMAASQPATAPVSTAPKAKAAQTQQEAPEPEPLFSVEFKGGMLSQFVDEVREQAAKGSGAPGAAGQGQVINVVYPADAAKVEVPQMSLRNVTALVALQSLEYATRPSASASATGMTVGLRVTPINIGRTGYTAGGGAPTFAVSLNPVPGQAVLPGGATPFAAVPLTKVFSVRDMLDSGAQGGKGEAQLPGLTLDQIVQPIETALTVDSGDNAAEPTAPRVMVHRESNLIIVRGTQRQVELARQVLDRLHEDVEVTRNRGRAERELQAALKEVAAQRAAEAVSAERLLRSATEQAQVAARRLEILQKEKPEDQNALSAAKRQAEDAERFMTNARQQFDRIQAQSGSEEVAARKLAAERDRANDTAKALRDQIEELRRQIEELKSSKGR